LTEPIPSDLRALLGDRYAIDRLLGRGGMGAVYLARDLRLDRPVALKVLPAEFASQVELRARFLRETRTAASFSHPNIVPVFSIEEHDDLLAFAMGYVEGESVADLVKRAGPMSVRDVVRMLQDVGYALAYAHGRGVVHRDIKPDNIMIERATGRALVMDFGISRSIDTSAIAVGTSAGLTRVGEVVGTPEFMSPEQASGDQIDGRSDLYSLGLTAFFALTGRLAITGENTQKVLVKQLTEAVPQMASQRRDVPTALAALIDQCVMKDAAERPASAQAVVEALDSAALRGVDVPLPVRLLSDDIRQASLIVLAAFGVGPLLFYYLRHTVRFDLDYILPMVLFGAVVWARMTQSLRHVRQLAERGFGPAEIAAGFSHLVAEREADRAQLRADATQTRRRRRDLVGWTLLLVVSYGIIAFVSAFMRTLIAPEIHQVSRPGVWLLYVAYVLRGLSIVGLLRSPLRRPPGEWLFRWFWMGFPGRALIRRAARGVALPATARVTSVAAPVAAAPHESAATRDPTSPAPHLPSTLEARVDALERWRDSVRDQLR
jgi:eukaryotic-like serine/threonine-protein kinase